MSVSPVPRIIHQTWKTADLPPGARRLVRSWQAHHPDWEHRLWTDDDNRSLIERSYPELLSTYDGYHRGVQRADLARVAILHRFGGVYADVDVECLASLEDLFPPDALSLPAEPPEHARLHHLAVVVSNAVMAAPAGHPLLRTILDEMRLAFDPSIDPPDVLGTTGPIFLTRLLVERPEGVHWIPPGTFFPAPAGSPLIDRVLELAPGHERHLEEWRRAGARGVHYWVSSWSRDIGGPLEGPAGEPISGFVFHPGVDSPGYDLGLRRRNVHDLAAECAGRSDAVAFNTDGYLKYYVPRRRHWRPMRWADPSQGLYVKRSYGSLAHLLAFVRLRVSRGPRGSLRPAPADPS